MERGNVPSHHGPEDCRCIISPSCLREVRRRRMVSLETISAVSRYSPEDLSAVERGDGGRCAEPDVIRAYEQAMGATMEAEVFTMLNDLLRSVLLAHEMLSRLYTARNNEAL